MAKFQAFQLEEQDGKILFFPPYVRRGTVGNDSNIVNNADGSVTITDYTMAMSWTPDSTGFVPITPGKTYYYDITYSNTSGNQFYIGIEKYDANKASGSNEECQYQVSDSSARDHYRVFGTVSITSANGNTPAYVRLRILNAWNGASDTKVATIHECIYREIDSLENLQITKNSAMCNTFVETNCIEGIRNNGITSFNELIEI